MTASHGRAVEPARSRNHEHARADLPDGLRQPAERSAAELDCVGHFETEGDHGTEYNDFSGVQPLLDEAESGEENGADGE